jgi:hypothetical protein
VTKNGLILVSLVAAVPGAVLVCLMVMAFLSYAAGPSLWPKALAGMALLTGLVVMLMPVGIFVFGPKAEKKSAATGDSENSETIVAESVSDSSMPPTTTDPNLEVVEAASEEFAMTGEIVTGDHDAGSEEFEVGSDFEMDAADDAVEEEAPKQKKK